MLKIAKINTKYFQGFGILNKFIPSDLGLQLNGQKLYGNYEVILLDGFKTLVTVNESEIEIIDFKKHDDSCSSHSELAGFIGTVLEVYKPSQLKTLENILINKFSTVCVDVELLIHKDSIYFKCNNSIYNICLGLDSIGNVISKKQNALFYKKYKAVTL